MCFPHALCREMKLAKFGCGNWNVQILPGLKVSAPALFLAHTWSQSCTFCGLFYSVCNQNMTTDLEISGRSQLGHFHYSDLSFYINWLPLVLPTTSNWIGEETIAEDFFFPRKLKLNLVREKHYITLTMLTCWFLHSEMVRFWDSTGHNFLSLYPLFWNVKRQSPTLILN